METTLLILAILAAVTFNVTSGFHDAAEIAAPAVVTRAMRPAGALAVFVAMTFVGPFLAGTAVADTVGSVVMLSGEEPAAALAIVTAGTAGAAAWNVVTWRAGIPSSSTHALVGGLVGVTVIAAGAGHVRWGVAALGDGQVEGVVKIVAALVLSPLAGLLAGWLAFRLGRALLRRATPRANRPLRRLQVAGTGLLAFAHGGNDAQKSMGVIALALVLGGRLSSFAVPTWVVLVSAATLVAGGLTGGWGVARTLGRGIYRLEPLHAAGAQTGAAGVIYGAALLGGPVSTTQVVGSSITGVGAGDRPRRVRWDTGATMMVAWLVTVPAAALVALAAWLPLAALVEIAG